MTTPEGIRLTIEWVAGDAAGKEPIHATGVSMEQRFREVGMLDAIGDVVVYAPNPDNITNYIISSARTYLPDPVQRAGLPGINPQLHESTTQVELEAGDRQHAIQVILVEPGARPHPITSKLLLGPNPQVIARMTFPKGQNS